MLVREQKIGQGSSVGQTLEDRVQKASVAQVTETRSDGARGRPGQLDFFLAEEDFGG